MLYMDGMKLVVFIFNFFQGSCEVLASFDSFCLLLLFCSAGCGICLLEIYQYQAELFFFVELILTAWVVTGL